MVAALKQIVMANDAQINWGLKFFSDDAGPCDATGAPKVAIGPGNYGPISTAIDAIGTPSGNTPTRDAVTTGAMYLSGVKDSNNKFILLATDGLPNCPVGCSTMSRPSNMCTTTDNPGEDQTTTQAIGDALNNFGIKTFVIGVGDVATAQNTLNNFAMAGGLPQKGAATSYYAATDATALENALNALVGAVFSCTVSLSSAPPGVHERRRLRDRHHVGQNDRDHGGPHERVELRRQQAEHPAEGHRLRQPEERGLQGPELHLRMRGDDDLHRS